MPMYSFHRNLIINYAETSNLSNKDIKRVMYSGGHQLTFVGYSVYLPVTLPTQRRLGGNSIVGGGDSYCIASGTYISLKVAINKACWRWMLV